MTNEYTSCQVDCVYECGEDVSVCRVLCLAASGDAHASYHQGLIQAKKLGIKSDFLQRLYALGYSDAREKSLAAQRQKVEYNAE